jgi:hypothetical protein
MSREKPFIGMTSKVFHNLVVKSGVRPKWVDGLDPSPYTHWSAPAGIHRRKNTTFSLGMEILQSEMCPFEGEALDVCQV